MAEISRSMKLILIYTLLSLCQTIYSFSGSGLGESGFEQSGGGSGFGSGESDFEQSGSGSGSGFVEIPLEWLSKSHSKDSYLYVHSMYI